MPAAQPAQLAAPERRLILAEIREELQRDAQDLLKRVGPNVPAGLAHLEANLEHLVAIVRRSSATHVEPYLSQIHDDICARCEHQERSAFCPVRHKNECILFCGAGPIVAAIRRALREIDIEHEISGLKP